MKIQAKHIASVALSACLLVAAYGCTTATTQSDSAPEAEAEAVDREALRADIEEAVSRAANAEYDNVTFVQRTETSAVAISQGQTQQQTILSTMKGELSVADDKRMHIAYAQQSNMQLGKTMYDMYIDPSQLVVEQSGKLYVDALDEQGFEGYAASITALMSEDEITGMLDVAKDFKLEEDEGDTVISITVDVDKLMEEEMVDASSLPDGNSIATMVMSYTIDESDRIESIRLISSTSGTPTYHITQTYQFSNYNETELPEWPDLNEYMMDQMGIQTDANGNLFIIADDGTVQYIDSISDDGTIYFRDPTGGADASGNTTTYVEQPTSSTDDAGSTTIVIGDSTETGETSDGGSSTGDSNLGRAYITASDGTIHYLDEPGSEIRDLGGATVFIDADGEWYFLDYGDDEE